MESLAAAAKALDNLLKFLAGAEIDGGKGGKVSDEYKAKFQKSISDDFNVAGGLAVMWEVVKDQNMSAKDKKATVLDFDRVLGLGLDKIKKDEVASAEAKNLKPVALENLEQEREKARAAKDWKKSDGLRDKINALGFDVKDTPEGQKISKK